MPNKIISNLESVVAVVGDMLLAIENSSATFSASIDDLKDYIIQNFPNSSETTKGFLELLTNAELAAGVDTTRAATAAAIASLFGTSILGDTGELKIPLIVGGVFVKGIIKYGVANDVTSAGLTVTFASAFPNAMRRAFLTPFQFSSGTVNPASAQIMAGANSFSTTGFFISNSAATENRSWQWMAIGY